MRIIHKVFSGKEYTYTYNGLAGAKKLRGYMQELGYTKVYIKRVRVRK